MSRLWMVDEFGHGGIGRYAVDVSNLIGDVVPTVVATSDLGPVPGLRGVSRTWFPRPAGGIVGRGLGGLVGLARAARNVRRGDVAWIPLGIRPSFELALGAVLRARGATLVVTVHNRGPHGQGESPTVVRAARQADAVVVHTDALEQWARQRGLVVVRLPFPPPDVRGADGAGMTRGQLGVPDGRLLVSLLGYLHHYKGVDLLVRALEQARSRDPQLPVHLLLAGRVPGDRVVQQALDSARGRPDVTLRPGWLEEAELADLLELTDVVALPYRDIDNSGSGALARSRGVPAVASDLPGLREIFGDAAVYVPVGDVRALADALLDLPRTMVELRRRAAAPAEVDLAGAYRGFLRQLAVPPAP